MKGKAKALKGVKKLLDSVPGKAGRLGAAGAESIVNQKALGEALGGLSRSPAAQRHLRVDAKLLRQCRSCEDGAAIGSHGRVPCSSCHGTGWLLLHGLGVTAATIDLAREPVTNAEVAARAVDVAEELLEFRHLYPFFFKLEPEVKRLFADGGAVLRYEQAKKAAEESSKGR